MSKNPSNHLRVHVVVNPNQAMGVGVIRGKSLGLDDSQQDSVVLGEARD